jgi:hypothetical protein
MAQFDRIKPEFGFDFAQHFVSGGVPPGVPASGKRNHRHMIILCSEQSEA